MPLTATGTLAASSLAAVLALVWQLDGLAAGEPTMDRVRRYLRYTLPRPRRGHTAALGPPMGFAQLQRLADPGSGLAVAPSRVVGGGRGLHTCRAVEAGSLLCEYTGRRVPLVEVAQLERECAFSSNPHLEPYPRDDPRIHVMPIGFYIHPAGTPKRGRARCLRWHLG